MNKMPLLENMFNIILAILFFLCFFSLLAFYSATHPPKIVSSVTPKNFGLNYEVVTFTTEDNVFLHGWFIPAKNPHAKTIILLHGYGGDKGDILLSRVFLHQDYNLLLFDFRYFGENVGSYSTVGVNEIKDIRAALNYLHSRGINEVGVWGLSMGGAVALMAATTMKEIKAIVAESSYARLDMMADIYFRIPLLRYPLGKLMRLWGYIFLGYDAKDISPMEAAAQLTIPILLIHSKSDTQIPYEHMELLQKSLKNNSSAEFLIYEEMPHGGIDAATEKRINEFFAKSIEN